MSGCRVLGVQILDLDLRLSTLVFFFFFVHPGDRERNGRRGRRVVGGGVGWGIGGGSLPFERSHS